MKAWNFTKRCYRFSQAMRHNNANKMTPPTPIHTHKHTNTPTHQHTNTHTHTHTHTRICHMRHSQNVDKTDSFLKPVLNICVLGSFIVGWGEWVNKEGAGILHQIYRFRGGVNIRGIGFIKVRVGII